MRVRLVSNTRGHFFLLLDVNNSLMKTTITNWWRLSVFWNILTILSHSCSACSCPSRMHIRWEGRTLDDNTVVIGLLGHEPAGITEGFLYPFMEVTLGFCTSAFQMYDASYLYSQSVHSWMITFSSTPDGRIGRTDWSSSLCHIFVCGVTGYLNKDEDWLKDYVKQWRKNKDEIG